MPKHRDAIPEDLKELIALCRAGRLFDVQEWIASGRRFRLPEGHFLTSPLRAALETGFHSMVEVLLRAGVDQEEKDDALRRAVWDRRLDLVELLVKYGGDHRDVTFDEVICTRSPPLIRWFIDRGIDLETGYPIAEAFRYRHREFLGIFMCLRDQVPTARQQAAMALRFHCRAGNMKWVSLLLWAGADPRARVPDLESSPAEEFTGTALEDAVSHNRIEVIRKIKIDPQKDDVTDLVSQCWMCDNPEIVRMLLELGADPNRGSGERAPMEALVRNFEWSIEGSFWRHDPDATVQCIEVAASFGGRWKPSDSHSLRYFRRAISRAEPYSAMPRLQRIVKSGAIEKDVFCEVMKTPRMKELLNSGAPGTVFLREFAGLGEKIVRKPRRKRGKGI